jgi:exopolysaccharide biosynthesis polyprenyl glycosylphosphotransferase
MDCVLIFVALVAALYVRFGGDSVLQGDGYSTSYTLITFLAGPAWLVSLLAGRAYDARLLDAGPGEYGRVFLASFRLAALVAIICYSFKIPLARGFVAVAVPLGTALLLTGRYFARKWLHHKRAQGLYCHRVLAVGDAEHLTELVVTVAREPHAGLVVAGVCSPGEIPGEEFLPGIPVAGGMRDLVGAARSIQADTIAVTASSGVTSKALRRLAWDLEGTGLDLVVAPALTDVTGPRIHIRPVAGLPLLQVEEPTFEGPRLLMKEAQDRFLAFLFALALSPFLLGIAIAVKVTSRGPVLFRQKRVGLRGKEFRVLKFRSMRVDAEKLLPELAERNEADGVLFKIRNDPRVTKVGRWLRLYSLDELPQLFNVLRGDMALVGPRPPLPAEVERYDVDVHRRFLVKPGITGLWQVGGRSDLSWEDSVRLDLHYVENWSFVLDLQILWKTAFSVFARRGAY